MNRLILFALMFGSLSAPGQAIFFGQDVSTQAATPTFSPGAGSVSNPTTVTASSTTTGSGCTMYFDASSSPATAQTTYSVTTAVTLYAQVRGCALYSNSAVASAAYTISSVTTFNTATCSVNSSLTGCTSSTSSTIVFSGVNDVGAKAIAVVVSWYSTGQTITVTHSVGSDGNAIPLAVHKFFYGSDDTQLYYWLLPSTGSSDTITVSFSSSGYGTAVVLPMHLTNGAYDSGSDQGFGGASQTTCSAGSSISPASGHLVIAGLQIGGNDTFSSIDGSYSLDQTTAALSGSWDGVAAAHWLSTGASTNPTWTVSPTAGGISCSLASFN